MHCSASVEDPPAVVQMVLWSVKHACTYVQDVLKYLLVIVRAMGWEYFCLQGARGGQPRGNGRRNRGTREDVMHNGLDLCQEFKLMKVWGRGVTMVHGWLWLVQIHSGWKANCRPVIAVSGGGGVCVLCGAGSLRACHSVFIRTVIVLLCAQSFLNVWEKATGIHPTVQSKLGGIAFRGSLLQEEDHRFKPFSLCYLRPVVKCSSMHFHRPDSHPDIMIRMQS